MCSGLDPILSSFFVIASRRARYTLHKVLKHILEEGSESDNESSEDEEEGAECFIHSDVPKAGPGTKPQMLARGASFGAPGNIRIFDSLDEDGGTRDKEGNVEDGDIDTHPVFMIYKQTSTLKATLILTLKATQSLKSTTNCLGTGILPAFL